MNLRTTFLSLLILSITAAHAAPRVNLSTTGIAISKTNAHINTFAVDVNRITPVSKPATFPVAVADLVVNAGAVTNVVGGNTDQKILAITASSSGGPAQILEKLVFYFDTDISTILNTSSFALKISGVPVGTAAYTYDVPSQTLTVSLISTNIGSSVDFDLHADVLQSASTTSFTVHLRPTENPLDNSGNTVDTGTLNPFAIFNTVGVSQLLADFVTNAGAPPTSNVTAGDNDRKILAITAGSLNGVQSLLKLIFVFDTDVASIINTSTFVLKAGGVAIGTAAYSYDALAKTLTVTAINTNISVATSIDLHANILLTATGGFTVILTTTENPADNSAATVDFGILTAFPAISNTVAVANLEATITQVTGGTVLVPSSSLEAGTTNRPLYGFSASSNGTQSMTSLTFNFLNQPDGLTNFRLFRGTAVALGAQIASAPDPASSIITFATPTETLPPTGSESYYYLVADVLGNVNVITGNNITISLDPTTTDITVTPGNKVTSAFSASPYTFRSSTVLLASNNEGETTPINFAVYSTKTATSILTTSNAQKIYSIVIGGNDSDNQPVNITRIRFNISDIRNIAALALVDPAAGNVTISEVDASAFSADPQTVDFGDALSTILSIPDAETDAAPYTLDLYATFRPTVIDNDEVIVTFNSIATDGINSGISASQTTFSSDPGENNITVVATQQSFATLSPGLTPITDADVYTNFLVRVTAVDALGNIDLNIGGSSTFDALSPSTENIAPSASQAWNNGVITWTVSLAPAGTYTLESNDSGSLPTISSPFTINSLGASVLMANVQSCQVGPGEFYIALPDLTINESDPADFSPGANRTFLLILPNGWEFQPVSAPGYVPPTMSYLPGQNFTAAGFTNLMAPTIARFTYSVTGIDKLDQMTISGLKVKNVNATTSGDLTRSGTGLIEGVDETVSLALLEPPFVIPTLDILVEAQPNNNYLDPNTNRFGVGDPAVIINGELAGNPISFADMVVSGNGVSLRTIGAPINADRYIFSPASVNAALHNITLNYTNPTTGCTVTTTEQFRVQDLAIVGLQDQFCNNDNTIQNLSVNPVDLPAGFDVYDFVYYDNDFANVSYPLMNVPGDLAATGVRLYASSVPVTLTSSATKLITGITVNPYGMLDGVWDNNSYAYVSTPIVNPPAGSNLYAYTSYLGLTIPAHGYNAGDRIYVAGYIDTTYPSLAYVDFTVHQVLGANDIIINLSEAAGYDHTVDMGWSQYYMYFNAPYNIAVNRQQSFDTKIDLRIPGHGFVTGDRVKISGFHNFSPWFNYGVFTVVVLDANYIQIDVKEIHGSGLSAIRATWSGETFYVTADPFIPLPGYIHDITQPFPHKGALRDITTNSQFKPGSFSTGWNHPLVYVLDRMLPTACAGVTGTPGCSAFPYHAVPVQLLAPPSVDFTGLNPDYCATAPGAPITLTGNQLDGSFSIAGGIGLTDNGANNPTAAFNPVAPGIALNTTLDVTYSFTSGCTGTITKQVTVHSLPVIDAGLDSELCHGNSTILGAATVATGNGPFSYSWNNIADLDNPTLPNPRATPTVNRTYTVTVTDAFGCSNTDDVTLLIAQRPTADAGPDMTICASDVFENGATVTLAGVTTLPGSAITGAWSGGTGTFSAGGTSPASSYTPNSSTLTTTLIETLTLTTADPASACGPESDQMTVTIYAVPPAPLAIQPAQVCLGTTVPTLEAIGTNLTWYTQIDPTKIYTKAPSGFAGVGSPINTGLASTTDLAKDYYAIQTINGCPSPPATATVVINPLPTPDFTIANVCLGDFTTFTDMSTLTYNNGRTGSITNWAWDMKGDNFAPSGPGNNTILNRTDSRGTFRNPEHIFSAPGTYDVEMIVTSSDGCSNTIAASASSYGSALEISALPKANFVFNSICDGDNTQFTYLDNDNPADNRTTGFSWNFGDATPNSTAEDPLHQFATSGSYTVTLTLTTDLNCQTSKTKNVFILPYLADLSNGYFQDFESPTTTGWIHEGLSVDLTSSTNRINDSWQIVDVPPVIKLEKNGTKAFITSSQSGTLPDTRSYGTNERSVLYTPCINLTSLPRPAISFDYWRDLDDKDGVYLEVSLDDGTSWERLGNGLYPNWYTDASISGLSSRPDAVYSSSMRNVSVGQPVDQFGFSGSASEPALADQWKSAKFSLDGYSTQTKLRLRFVFGSNGDISDRMGFVMDNFKISSRNRKVLVENFTNTGQAANNANFISFKSDLLNTEIVKLQYHSSLLGDDANNLMNPTDLNARAAMYGLTNQANIIPRVFVDGTSTGVGYFTDPLTPWAEDLFSSEALSAAPLGLTITTVDGEDEELRTQVTITANEPITMGQPVLIVAVVEKVVGSDRYVVRKLLPSPSGFPLAIPIAPGLVTPTPLEFSWFVNIEGIDVSKLAVVAFVQDLETRKVLQSEVDFNPAHLPRFVTGVAEENIDKSLNVYPNPADNGFVIELPYEPQTQTEMRIFDQMGKLADHSFLEKGVRNKTINTSGLPGGVYFIQITSPQGPLTKKILVTHSH
jgi:PKD repeat protein